MKKFFTCVLAFAVLSSSMAIVPVNDGNKPLNATEIMLPIGKTGQMISLMEFSRLKPAAYEQLAKVKLGFFDRMAYKMAMKKLKKSIAADGTIKNKKMVQALTKNADFTDGFHLGGFALGLLVGLIGVLIAYLINDDKKSNRIKWSWIGLAVWVAVILVAVIL